MKKNRFLFALLISLFAFNAMAMKRANEEYLKNHKYFNKEIADIKKICIELHEEEYGYTNESCDELLLVTAARLGRVDVVSYILNNYTSEEIMELLVTNDRYALNEAIYHNHYEVVEALLASPYAKVFVDHLKNTNPLSVAIYNKVNLPIIDLLLQSPFAEQFLNSDHECGPIHQAISNENYAALRLICNRFRFLTFFKK